MTTLAPNTNTQSPLWNAEEVATYLQLSPETVRKLARDGIIPSMKVGKRVWRFKAEVIQDWLKQKHDVTYD